MGVETVADIAVVIPTYNERETVADIVHAVHEALDGEDHEIVIVDDSSPDGTADVVRAMDDVPVRLIERTGKRGLGAAYRDAFAQVDADIVVQMDADFSHPPERIPALVDAVRDGADVAVGSRYVSGGERKDPLHRRIFPLIGSFLYRVLLRSPVRDVTSGFKAYRGEMLDGLDLDRLPSGFHFQAASLFALIADGADVEEVAITFRERKAGEPKYSTRDLVDNVLLLARLTVRKNRRPLKFAAVGSTGVALDMGLLYLLTEFAGLYYLFSAVISAETATLSNFTLNDLWTFRDRRGSGARAAVERLAKYHAVAVTGIGIKLLFLYLLTEFGGFHYLLSNLVAIGLAFVWNYTVNALWTWQKI